MEDFLESTNININNLGFYSHIKQQALGNPQEEVCGLILKNSLEEVSVLACENIHEDKKEAFVISPEIFLNILNKGYQILAVYHSHVNYTAQPSQADLRQSESLCLPFVVYSVRYDDFYVHIPKSSTIKSLLGRRYVDGLQNCITLVVDFYRKNYKFKFDNFNFYLKREGNDWGISFNKLLEVKNVFKKNNFSKIKKINVEHGDLVIFQRARNQVHLGVCLENEKILHHPFHGLSVESFFNEEIKENLHSVYRKSV